MNGVTSLVLLPLFSGPAYDAVGGSPPRWWPGRYRRLAQWGLDESTA
jgi:hypothetical protein